MLNRWLQLVSAIALTACRTHVAPQPRPAACTSPGYVEDVDAALRDIREHYIYFDDKAVDWTRAETVARDTARSLKSKRELVGALEQMLDNLYDAHAIVRANTSHSPRLVPSGLDLWAEWRDTTAVVTAVRPGFGAEQAGVRPGMQIIAINGVAVRDAAEMRFGPGVKSPAPTDAWEWALLSALAGRHDVARVLSVRDENGARESALDATPPFPIDRPRDEPAVESHWVDSDGSSGKRYGYIRLNALGDSVSVTMLDSALATFRDAPGLILDLRNTPGGGNTSVAEPILGRFITGTRGYQRVVPKTEPSYTRTVSARGPFRYDGPLVVLVGRWTGSMGEGMAIGLDGMHRGVVVGTAMAGLAGAVDDFRLPCSGLGIAFPTARLLHLDGTPRERWVPPVTVDLRAAGDPVLQRGIEVLSQLTRS